MTAAVLERPDVDEQETPPPPPPKPPVTHLICPCTPTVAFCGQKVHPIIKGTNLAKADVCVVCQDLAANKCERCGAGPHKYT